MYTLNKLLFPWKTRKPLFLAIQNVVLSPLHSSTFFTQYVADVFTSLIKVFQDWCWTICYVLSGDFLNHEAVLAKQLTEKVSKRSERALIEDEKHIRATTKPTTQFVFAPSSLGADSVAELVHVRERYHPVDLPAANLVPVHAVLEAVLRHEEALAEFGQRAEVHPEPDDHPLRRVPPLVFVQQGRAGKVSERSELGYIH